MLSSIPGIKLKDTRSVLALSICPLKKHRYLFQLPLQDTILSMTLNVIKFAIFAVFIWSLQQKVVPFMVVQLCSGACHFYIIYLLSKATFVETELDYIIVTHVTSFLQSSAFVFLWVLSPETFPQHCRQIAIFVTFHRMDINSMY